MKVSVSNIENTRLSRGAKKITAATAKPAFGAAINNAAQTITTIKKDFPLIPRLLFWLNKHNGEIANNIVIAIGTAFVAPIFIAFNPFSKEDKETKIYSAWRQPLSAVLSLTAAVCANMQFNRLSEKAASIGQLGDIDMTATPADSYLKAVIKKDNPKISQKALEDRVAIKKMDIFKDKVEKARKNMAHQEITREMLVGRETYDEAMKEVEKTCKSEMAAMSKSELKKFKHAKAMDIAYQKIKQELKEEALKKHTIRQYHQEGKTLAEAIETATSELAKAKDKTLKTRYKAIIDQLEAIKAYEAHTNMPDFSSLKNLGSTYDEIYKNVKIKQVVSAAAENARFSLGKWKKCGGIIISLLTLPIACGALNWIYPRMMEIIMPEMAKKKNAANAQQVKIEQRKEVKA